MSSLTKTVCFAEEMTRLVLTKPQLYRDLGLDKVWDSMDYKVLPGDERVVSLRIRIRGFSRVVYSTCHVMINHQDRRDDEGQCRIELRGNNPHDDAYWCMCVGNEMRYFGAVHLITNPAFGLEEDLAADLSRVGVRTCLDLQMLSERQLAEIFRPRPETDPYVLTHPDLLQYATDETSDKLQRLRPALEKMGVKLSGSPLSPSELMDAM